jgi:hypothetical protein
LPHNFFTVFVARCQWKSCAACSDQLRFDGGLARLISFLPCAAARNRLEFESERFAGLQKITDALRPPDDEARKFSYNHLAVWRNLFHSNSIA